MADAVAWSEEDMITGIQSRISIWGKVGDGSTCIGVV